MGQTDADVPAERGGKRRPEKSSGSGDDQSGCHLVARRGRFREMQSALNSDLKAKPEETTYPGLIRARAASIGLVAAWILMIVRSWSAAGLTAPRAITSISFPFGR